MGKTAVALPLLLSLVLAPLWGEDLGSVQPEKPVAAEEPQPNQPRQEEDPAQNELLKKLYPKIENISNIPPEKLGQELDEIFPMVAEVKNEDVKKAFLEYLENKVPKPPPREEKKTDSIEKSLWSARMKFPEEMKKRDRRNPRWWVASGKNHALMRDHRAAYNNYNQALQLGASDPETLTGYAGAAHHLGDYRLARTAAAIALKMDPKNAAAFSIYKLSQDRESTGSLPSALGALQSMSGAAAESEESAPEGESAPRSGMTPAEVAAEAARQGSSLPTAVAQSASLTRDAASALGVRDYALAHEAASKAVALNPRNAQAWNYRAIADNKLARYEQAVQDSSYALGLVPNNSPALQSRAWAFSKMGKYKEGLADANAALEREPDNAFAYQNRAFALAGLGDRDGMMASLKRSAELDPRFSERYDRALQAPANADVLFLFDESPGPKAVSGVPAPIPRNKRFLTLSLISVAGGCLVALGLLHILAPRWRQKVMTTVRRFVGSAPSAADGEVGVWGQYELVREVGSGGMGVVYEAKDRSLDRIVAIKRMRPELRLDGRERARFVTEAKTVAALHHPNIVDIYSIIEEEKDVYLVFEYISGKTLSSLLEAKGPLPFDTARQILKFACEAVEYAHRHKVIHRDVKPSNIMINEEGVAKVMDFGVARQAKEALSKTQMTNTIEGTPAYMAPEQEQGTVRAESDVYSLGVIFYEMISGQLPFPGQGAGMLLNKINGKHTPLSGKAGLPAGLNEVMAKVLSPDPAKRYHTPADFLSAVELLGAVKLI